MVPSLLACLLLPALQDPTPAQLELAGEERRLDSFEELGEWESRVIYVTPHGDRFVVHEAKPPKMKRRRTRRLPGTDRRTHARRRR